MGYEHAITALTCIGCLSVFGLRESRASCALVPLCSAPARAGTPCSTEDERSRQGPGDPGPPPPGGRAPPPGQAPDVQSYRPSLPGRSQPDPLSAEVGSLPGAARDPAPVAPPARREEVDQAPSSSGASGSGFRGLRAGPPGGSGEPEVGLPADQGRASETRGEGLGHHHRHPAPAFWAGSGPARGPTWSEFLRSQAKGILACDFLTVETIRLKTLYVLVWIELGTKRVRLAGSTANPDSVGDQSSPEPRHGPPRRRANGEAPDSRPGFQVLQSVRRGDTRRGTRIILTPIRAPNANSVCERWVGTVRGRVLGLDARPRPEGTWSASFGSRSAIQGGQARIEGSRFKRR